MFRSLDADVVDSRAIVTACRLSIVVDCTTFLSTASTFFDTHGRESLLTCQAGRAAYRQA
eukprot:scaffold306671_cov37-Prasinocladus_malaysianus.AAC.1